MRSARTAYGLDVEPRRAALGAWGPMTTPTRASATTVRRLLEPVVTGDFPRSALTDCLLLCGLAGRGVCDEVRFFRVGGVR